MSLIRFIGPLALVTATVIAPSASSLHRAAAQQDSVSVVAAGLTNPRGFTWAADGALIVAEAGVGGDQVATGEVDVPAPAGPYTGALTARVVDASSGCPVVVADGLPSAISASGEAIGVADVAFIGESLYALVTGGGAAHGNADAPNGIYRIAAEGSAELLVDLGDWLRANPVDAFPQADYDPEGSFFAMVASGDALWVTESNSEQILRVGTDGSVSRIADLSGADLVPTAIAPALDGGVFVGQLTGAPYPAGGASVIRVDEDGAVTTIWTGLTAVTGLAVSPDGTLYAAQLAETRDRPPFFQLASGSILRQTGEASAETVAAGLNLPVALRFGPDGRLYVSGPAVGGAQGAGTLLAIDPGATNIAVQLDALVGPDCAGGGTAGDGTGGGTAADAAPAPTAISDGTGGVDAGGTGSSAGGETGDATSELVVRIFDFGFDPPSLTIRAGSTVIWANTGAVSHTVTGVLDGPIAWDSGELAPGGLFTMTFDQPGTYAYVCTLHPDMTGVIVVE